MTDTKKTCFIIMPLTTPEPFVDGYRDGVDHFKHALQCLILPAVEKAGFEPIPPIAKGSDLIHSEIIKNLESSDLVLCDMSCLNPNVFFEFGIRTALNKPVCVVKDDLTLRVPFDIAILNHREYDSTLNAWGLEGEVAGMSAHVRTSFERSKDKNTLWQHFGVRADARSLKVETGVEAKLEYLMVQFDSLREQLQVWGRPAARTAGEERGSHPGMLVIAKEVIRLLPPGVSLKSFRKRADGVFSIEYSGPHYPAELEEIRQLIMSEHGATIEFYKTLHATGGERDGTELR